MKENYSDELTLDRIDNNGNYCKKNCRWTTQTIQNNNRSNSISYKGETASKACKRIGGNNIVYGRLKKGWTLERAFTTPLRKHNK